MSSRERLTGPLDPDRCDDPPPQPGGTATPQPADTPTLAEALEEVARTEARAGVARGRALQLSRQAAADAEDAKDVDDSAGAAERASPRWARLRRRFLRRPGRESLAVGAAVVLICAFLGTTGYAVWYHHKTTDERQRPAEFAAAARQGVITLMSIDANKARDDLQRIIDDSTGQFKTAMLVGGNDLVEQVEQSKVSTEATVKAVAVESMSDDSAVVLVAAQAEVTNPDKTKPPPRLWRVVMSLQKDAGQIKMSKVEFVP
jgi:Mce-associated membrane protein